MNANVTCGVYGKILTNADFVHRDLPRAFVSPWDQWLSEGLQTSRQALGERWMAAYLKSPPWRFAVDAGLFGPSPWIGLFVTSIDHVKRCYPLTLAVALPEFAVLARLRSDVDPFLEQLEDIALDLVAGDRAVDNAMEEIGSIARQIDRQTRSPAPMLRSANSRATVRINQPRAPTVSAMVADDMPLETEGGASCWWHRGWGDRPPTRVVARGLPPADGFAAFLDASWASHGWIADA